MGTRFTKQLIEGCLRRRLWIKAIITKAPEGGTEIDSLLNFLAKAAAKYAGRSGDFKQASRSCKKNKQNNIQWVQHKHLSWLSILILAFFYQYSKLKYLVKSPFSFLGENKIHDLSCDANGVKNTWQIYHITRLPNNHVWLTKHTLYI